MPKLFNLTDFTDKVKFTPKNAIFVSNDTDFVLAGCDRNKELSMLDVRPRF